MRVHGHAALFAVGGLAVALGVLAVVAVIMAGSNAQAFGAGPSPDPDHHSDGERWQQGVLADGKVEFDDYVRAQEATADCVRSEGYTVEFPHGALVPHFGADPALYPDFAILVEDDLDEAHLDRVVEQCTREWSRDVVNAWFEANRPELEEQHVVYQYVWDCARQEGMKLSSPPTEEDAHRAALKYDCDPRAAQ